MIEFARFDIGKVLRKDVAESSLGERAKPVPRTSTRGRWYLTRTTF